MGTVLKQFPFHQTKQKATYTLSGEKVASQEEK